MLFDAFEVKLNVVEGLVALALAAGAPTAKAITGVVQAAALITVLLETDRSLFEDMATPKVLSWNRVYFQKSI